MSSVTILPSVLVTIAVIIEVPPGTFDSGLALMMILSTDAPSSEVQVTSILSVTAPIKAVTVGYLQPA